MLLGGTRQCVVEHDAPGLELLIRKDEPMGLLLDPRSKRIAWVIAIPGRARSTVETMQLVHCMSHSSWC